MSSEEQETNERQYSDPIPLELLFVIFLSLPAKTLARCVCVSKLWASIIRSQDFIESFHSRSRILFLVREFHETRFENWFFLSSSNQEETSSSSSTFLSSTTCHISRFGSKCHQPQEVNGLICCGYGTLLHLRGYNISIISGFGTYITFSSSISQTGTDPVIYNPRTGKSLTLPKFHVGQNVGPYVENIMGFDPINEQYKVLSMTPLPGNHSSDSIIPYKDHKVITLEADDQVGSWRMIKCNTIHCPRTISVCINGVLYYGAYIGENLKQCSLVRFHVRTEKFGFIEMPESVKSLSKYSSTLMNYNGKIALSYSISYDTYELWVLEDAKKKNEWSKMCFSTSSWIQQPNVKFNVEGVTRMGEIILTPRYSMESYVVYYNLVTKQFRKIGIDGFKNPGGLIVSWEYVDTSTMLL